jgi:hypothetical protein
MNDPSPNPGPPPRNWRKTLLAAGCIFVAGLVLAGWAATSTNWGSTLRAKGDPVPQIMVDPARLNQPPVAPSPETNARIAQLEAQLSQQDGTSSIRVVQSSDRVSGLVLAFAARRALERGQSLGPIKDELQAHFGASAPHLVAAIESAATQPVSLAELKTEFELLAPSLTDDGQGWLAGMGSRLSHLVSIRRSSEGSVDPHSQLAEARRQLDNGHVGTALGIVSRLPGKASATDWLAKAKRFADADAALNSLEAKAFDNAPLVEQPVPPPASVAPPAPLVLPNLPSGAQ